MPPTKLLTKQEVPKTMWPFINFNNQQPINGATHIQVLCLECNEWRWIKAGAIRSSMRRWGWTSLCRTCHNRRIAKQYKGMKGRKGRDHPSWNGGRWTDPRGYVMRNLSSFAMSQRSILQYMSYDRNGTEAVLEHRAIVALALGRPLESDEWVHHINGDKADNRLENLQLVDHHKRAICPCCGWRMDKWPKPSRGMTRQFL